MPKANSINTQILVLGSGAGGATTAVTLAEAGFAVLLVEEGSRFDLSSYGMSPVQTMPLLYRNRGMTPILGSLPIGYVEGRCVGGSTEINSGFWQRLAPEFATHWQNEYGLADVSENSLKDYYAWAEKLLHVSYRQNNFPKSSQLFYDGAHNLGWDVKEIPRAAKNCENTNTCSTGCPKDAKQGVSRNLIPLAEQLGVKILTSCKVQSLVKHKNQVVSVIAKLTEPDNSECTIQINAEHIFVCCGPTQSPALLRRSGIKSNIGESFHIHPMLKVAALFKDTVDASASVLPLFQVKEFCPDISLGGSFFSLGHLALVISDNWEKNKSIMPKFNNMANYYVSIKSTGKGSVYTSRIGGNVAVPRYELSKTDLQNLSQGFSHLCKLLFTAGATRIYPSIQGMGFIDNEAQSNHYLNHLLPKSSLSLTTVHAFSSIPIGEYQHHCAANSFGKIYGYENLYVNDASMLPGPPGTNPQGIIMALARRNALHFIANLKNNG